jgi:hypothetical protein
MVPASPAPTSSVHFLIFIFFNDQNFKIYTMSNARQQQFIQTLIETGEKLSLEDFFKKIHKKFYPNYDISFSLRRRFAP